MDWKTEFTLRSYLLQEMHFQYDQREESLASALRTSSQLKSYSGGLRAGYLNLLGEIPPFRQLNPVVTGIHKYKGYRVENVVFESRHGSHITANVYLPEGHGPFPAALIFCGHEMSSKATDSYRRTALLFSLNGFVVMVVDPVSQGERVQFTDTSGKPLLRGSTTEHTLLNAGAALTGTSVASYELTDNVSALDYLVTRSEVDTSRIGCLGNSGGGAQTIFFMVYDNRIKVAAPCSFVTSREREYEMNGVGDGCQQLPREGLAGIELADYIIMFAPKPVLILAGKFDFVDYTGTLKAFDEIRRAYQTLGEPEHAGLFTCDDGHGISKPKREAAVRWFREWLASDTAIVREMDADTGDPSETNVTISGQVTTDFPGEITIQELNRHRIVASEQKRHDFIGKGNDSIISMLSTLLAIDPAGNHVTAEKVASSTWCGYRMDKIILRSEGEVPLPVLVLDNPEGGKPDTTVVIAPYPGKREFMSDTTVIRGLLDSGCRLFITDLRGIGETSEKPQANDPKYYNSEYNNAMLGIHIGRPLPGQRTTDLISLLDYIESSREYSGNPVRIMASGPAALPALFASILRKSVGSVQLSDTIRSFKEITANPIRKEAYSYIVPDILSYFDIDDLVTVRPGLKVGYR